MSRETATKETVRAAREQLLAHGVTPTQRGVHAITGGSMTRVNQFMRELDDESKTPGLRIQERLGALVNELHAELQKQAKDTSEKEAAKNQKIVDAAKEDLKVVQQDFAALQLELASANEKISEQSAEFAITVDKLNKANETISAQAVSLQATEQARSLLQSRVRDLEESLAKTQDAFTAYQDHAADDRAKSTNAFESALEGMKTELREARNQVSTANLARQETITQNLALNRDAERLSGEVGRQNKRIHELEDKLRAERAKSDGLREAETSQKIATAKAEGQISLLTKQLEDCSAARSATSEQVKSSEVRIQQLEQAKAELESEILALRAAPTPSST